MKRLHGSIALTGLVLALNLSALADLVKINPDIPCAKRSLSGFYLVPEALQKLTAVQEELTLLGFSLIVYEAYVPYTEHKKTLEMDNEAPCPEECLRHSCGTAVDVGLEKADGTSLPMPTAFDEFGPEARPDNMNLSPEVIEYRTILREAMERHGFRASPHVWYHFECSGCDADCYLDKPLEELE